MSALGRVLATTLITGAMLLPIRASGQEPQVQHELVLGRRFADDYAQALVANRRDYLYGHVAQKVRAAYTQEEFFKPFDLAQQYFGQIETIQPVGNGVGFKMGVFGKIDTLSYQYSITTTKNLPRLILEVLTDRADTSHGLVAYHIIMRTEVK